MRALLDSQNFRNFWQISEKCWKMTFIMILNGFCDTLSISWNFCIIHPRAIYQVWKIVFGVTRENLVLLELLVTPYLYLYTTIQSIIRCSQVSKILTNIRKWWKKRYFWCFWMVFVVFFVSSVKFYIRHHTCKYIVWKVVLEWLGGNLLILELPVTIFFVSANHYFSIQKRSSMLNPPKLW